MSLHYGRFVDPDILREKMLDQLRLQYLGTVDLAEKHEIFNAMRTLIKGRSKAQVEQMETARGLR